MSQNRGCGGQNVQEMAVNEAMMEQLKRQDQEERCNAYVQRRARETAEAVLSGKTLAEAAANEKRALAAPPQMQSSAPVALPRPMYYGPMMPQMGFGGGQMGYSCRY